MNPRQLFLLLPVLFLWSCSTGVDLPSGTSRGYSSVRLSDKAPHIDTPDRYKQGQKWARQNIRDLCQQKGLQVSEDSAQLEISRLVLIQDNSTTMALREYFTGGLEADAMEDLAHQRGVVQSKEVEQFNRAGLVIDVREINSGDLVYRNYVKRDILPEGTPLEVRQRLVQEAVIEALGPFFS